MSVAIAVKKGSRIVLATDSLISFGSFNVSFDNHRANKIRKIGESYVAAAGWALYDNILDNYLAGKKAPVLKTKQNIYSFFIKFWKVLHEKYSFVNDQCDGADSPFGEIDSSFLIINKTGIYFVASDMSVTRFEKYFSIGAGSDFAFGSIFSTYDTDMNAREIAVQAARAAIAFNNKCGGEIDMKTIAV